MPCLLLRLNLLSGRDAQQLAFRLAARSGKAAQYLATREWRDVTEQSGWIIGAVATEQPYRSGVHAMLFPNRLETTLRLDPIRD